MTNKQVDLLGPAVSDLDDAAEYYQRTGGPLVVDRFLDAFEHALRQISRHPSLGSPSFGAGVGLPDVRSRVVGRFPYVVFYVDCGDHVDVWRVLHERRDIAGTVG